jgi:hypothetical protein
MAIEPQQDYSAGVIRGESLCVSHNGANQFDEAGRDSEEKSRKVEPCCVQPTVERGTSEPSHDKSGRKHKRQLAIARRLNPEVFLSIRARFIGIRIRRHLSDYGYSLALIIRCHA